MESPQDLVRANLPLVQRIVARACRRNHLPPAEAEDFASEVMLALIENDYAIVRRFEGRSSFAAFIAAVVEHRMVDRFMAARGRWNPSAEAERIGPAAVLLERLIYRDGQPLDAALPLVRDLDATLTRAGAEAILARLPLRTTRPRAVALEVVDPDADALASPERADARAVAADVAHAAQHASRVVREHLDALPQQDRMLLRLHFGAGMSLADVARALQVPQRPLYRRMEALLSQLHDLLHEARVDEAAAAELIGAPGGPDLDFGLSGWKNGTADQTLGKEQR